MKQNATAENMDNWQHKQAHEMVARLFAVAELLVQRGDEKPEKSNLEGDVPQRATDRLIPQKTQRTQGDV